MTSNPTDGIRLMQFDEVTKAILSLKEIQKLAITPCPNNEVKRAFLFSCYCGLRWCDVHQLQYKDIDFSSNRLTILQQESTVTLQKRNLASKLKPHCHQAPAKT